MIQNRIGSRETFGDRVKWARQKLRREGRKLTQGELAVVVGVERNTVSRWENGGMLPRDPAVIAALATVLGVTADWLISGDRPPSPPRKLGEGPAGQYLGSASGQVPRRAAELAAGYLKRLQAAGCSEDQVRNAESLLFVGAMNHVAREPFESRTEEAVCADVDSAWDMIVQILRRDGIRP